MTEQLSQDSIFNAATYFNNFRNTKVFPSKFQFSSVFSRDILLKNLIDGQYIINLDKYTMVGTHRAFCWNNKVPYFDIFFVEHISKEIKKIIGNKNIIISNIFRIQVYDNMWILVY